MPLSLFKKLAYAVGEIFGFTLHHVKLFGFADSSDIVSCNSKLILGLMWTLILHYSISMPMWDGLENATTNNNQTPKQKLLGWITSRIPDRPIRNFTTDWNDGTAIGALVDAVAPGMIWFSICSGEYLEGWGLVGGHRPQNHDPYELISGGILAVALLSCRCVECGHDPADTSNLTT